MGLFSSNNNEDVLGKLRQLMNEVLELKAEESARSKELIKQMDALNEKVGFLSAKMSEANAKIAGLNTRVDDLNQHAGTLEGFIKNGATKPMMEMLGKKVNEIGKTVDDHFESFVKVSETDSELFKLIAQALTGKVLEEASAEPKLTEKANENASGTDGNGGKVDGKKVKKAEKKNPIITKKGELYIDKKCQYIYICKEFLDVIRENGFTHLTSPVKGPLHPQEFVLHFNREARGRKICKDGRVYSVGLAKRLFETFGGVAKAQLLCNGIYLDIFLAVPGKKENEK